MPASEQTTYEIADAIEEYMERDLIPHFLSALKGIEGNKSFRQTVSNLIFEMSRRGHDAA